MLRPKLVALFAIGIAIAGCKGPSIQSSSVDDYLKRYNQGVVSAEGTDPLSTEGIDRQILAAANVSPNLTFPGRFGVARIEKNRIEPIPEDEFRHWKEMAEKFGTFGELVPVNPVVASLVSATENECGSYWNACRAVNDIRMGAARQHLDAVLIYEVHANSNKDFTPFAVADLTFIGGAFLPTRSIEAASTVSAVFLDVRNGYPYGAAQASSELESYFISWGSDAKEQRMREEAVEESVADLIPKVEQMFLQLIAENQS
ncbi:MAG: hypothetical protein AAGE80_18750 [Pseudomonadota bacterium]